MPYLKTPLAACIVAVLAACSNQPPSPKSSNAAVAIATPVATASPTTAPLSDDGFMRSASAVEAGRYALGVIGQKQANSNAIRSLAARISSDAAESSRWLDAYARKKNVHIAAHPTIRAAYQYSQLTGRRGAAFDRSFVQAIRIDTTIALDSFKQELRHTKDPALQNFAKRQIAQFESNLKQLPG